MSSEISLPKTSPIDIPSVRRRFSFTMQEGMSGPSFMFTREGADAVTVTVSSSPTGDSVQIDTQEKASSEARKALEEAAKTLIEFKKHDSWQASYQKTISPSGCVQMAQTNQVGTGSLRGSYKGKSNSFSANSPPSSTKLRRSSAELQESGIKKPDSSRVSYQQITSPLHSPQVAQVNQAAAKSLRGKANSFNGSSSAFPGRARSVSDPVRVLVSSPKSPSSRRETIIPEVIREELEEQSVGGRCDL